jgi:hypothetical protein
MRCVHLSMVHLLVYRVRLIVHRSKVDRVKDNREG